MLSMPESDDNQALIYPPPSAPPHPYPLFIVVIMFLVLSYLSSCFISPRLAEQDLLKELGQSPLKKVYPCHLLLLLTLI